MVMCHRVVGETMTMHVRTRALRAYKSIELPDKTLKQFVCVDDNNWSCELEIDFFHTEIKIDQVRDGRL